MNDEEAIKNNLLKLDIYYKEFNFENIVEVPGYEVCALICDILLYFCFKELYRSLLCENPRKVNNVLLLLLYYIKAAYKDT